MDDQTALVLAIQLTALCSIAASLLIYLLCKARRGGSDWRGDGSGGDADLGSGRSVLVTCVQNELGLELSLRLAALGFRVFGGLRDGNLDCDAARVIKAKVKAAEASGVTGGAVILIPLDVTREDSLHEGVEHIRRHLPVGQNGLWAVLNTTGEAVKGRLEAQESCQWDSMFKVNVVGTLRMARALLPLLRATKGRLVTVGLTSECQKGSTGVVAYAAARHAVAGASCALANELANLGVSVVIVNLEHVSAEQLYHSVRARIDDSTETKTPSNDAHHLRYNVSELPEYVTAAIESTLLVARPKQSYDLRPPVKFGHYLNAITSRFNPALKKEGKNSGLLTTV